MTRVRTVAHLTPYSTRFPLASHNGRYDWLLDLATRQVAAGLNVVIYSNPASRMPIPGVTWRSTGNVEGSRAEANHDLWLEALQDDGIDIYHSHYDAFHYTVAQKTAKPIVFTQHWWPTEQTVGLARAYPGTNVWAVPPTRYMLEYDQRAGVPTKGHIYHGIDLTKFRYHQGRKTNRLLFVGRISPEKNLPLAIQAAQLAGLPLDIVGKVAAKNQAYWDELQPLIDGERIRYIGPKTSAELVELYNQALAVLFPSNTNEPFGLVAIEAQACGTPIFMRRGGSRHELVLEGQTGFLADNADEFAEAIARAEHISPEACVSFAQRFDVNRMVAEYSELYDALLTQSS